MSTRPQPELAFEEDLAVLDGATGTLPWLCVCVHWAPETSWAALRPVHARDNAALVAASQQLVALATSGDCWERFVWTARRHATTNIPCAMSMPATEEHEQFARQLLRAERQVFFVGQDTGQAVFAIRVMLQPLTQAVQTPGAAARLHDSLASMSQAVLDYKNLRPARDRLLHWLALSL